MICSISSPPIRRLPGEGRGPRGFTLVELLTVILILAVLITLLLPALNFAVGTAKNAAVGGEINQLAQALASFKARYGDSPPSRIYLSEDGNLMPANGSTQIATGDITYAQLGQRSIAAMRKFFPRVTFNLGTATNNWYDFNGDGLQYIGSTNVAQWYILSGHECLVFFLGGVPMQTATGYGMTGFGKDPTNPFTNNIVGNAGYSANRQPPFFEFNASRLAVDLTNPTLPGIPGYLDSLGNTLGNGMTNFYAYFSAYGNNGYDPNDVNFAESDVNGNGPIGLGYHVAVPVTGGCISAGPNPYTSSFTTPTTGLPTFLNPQSFQIISSGIDGLYGVGGQYQPDNTAGTLPYDSSSTYHLNTTATPPSWTADSDPSIRYRERDNVTNFHNGKLE
ncbi:MAG TPA: type II secretion system protein [Isosphaeraceae bacterium]|nr:type II secretion system protein [Isosphaeraceae bacterium]